MKLVDIGYRRPLADLRGRLRHILCVIVSSILAIWAAAPASAQTVSLIGAWRFCSAGACTLSFAFRPNGTVIKQYVLAGTTVTAHGRYTRRDDTLRITWTRFSPRRVCASPNPADRRRSSCKPTSEPAAQGPIRFEGFNTLVWTVGGSQPLRLARIEN
jgi:hypothetical protein